METVAFTLKVGWVEPVKSFDMNGLWNGQRWMDFRAAKEWNKSWKENLLIGPRCNLYQYNLPSELQKNGPQLRAKMKPRPRSNICLPLSWPFLLWLMVLKLAWCDLVCKSYERKRKSEERTLNILRKVEKKETLFQILALYVLKCERGQSDSSMNFCTF